MKKIIFFVAVFLLPIVEMSAQARMYSDTRVPGQTWILATVGPAYIISSDSYDKGLMSNKMVSIGFRHLFPNNIGYKAGIHYGFFKGTDSASVYTSKLLEASFQLEYSLLGGPFTSIPNKDMLSAFGGAAYNLNMSTSTSALTSTSYTKSFPSLFVGLGYQRTISRRFTMGLNLTLNYLFSPYLLGRNSYSGITYSVDNKGNTIANPYGLSNNIIPSLDFMLTYNIDKKRKNKKDCDCGWTW